jgi:hypothetical protein
MSPSASPAAAPRRLSFAQKLALASGAGAAITGIAPQSADAAVIQSTTLPLSPPATPGTTSWDIDGDGTEDFQLRNLFGNLASFGNVGNAPSLARFVVGSTVTESGFAKLNSGFNVGAIMPGFKFATNNEFISMTNRGNIGGAAASNGWALGDIGFFGFKFTNGSGVHYGWGTIDIHGVVTGTFVQGQGFTVTEAYYNDVAGAPITVGDRGGTAVPEIDPASAGSVLALVMGSLAMLERRRLRRAADDSVTTVSA